MSYTKEEKDDIWTAIDNLRASIIIIRDHLEKDMDSDDLEYLDSCIAVLDELV